MSKRPSAGWSAVHGDILELNLFVREMLLYCVPKECAFLGCSSSYIFETLLLLVPGSNVNSSSILILVCLFFPSQRLF